MFLLLAGIAGNLTGQNRPFPQNVDYPFGYKPSTLTSSLAQSEYERWKSRYLVTCDSVYRVATTETTRTLSEGTGYGMIITAYYGEKEYFDGLLAFYKRKRTANARYLMAWDVTCEGINDPNCATDGDLDVAYALLLAYNQWGGKYLDEAKSILSKFVSDFIVPCGDSLYVLRPGAGWGGCGLTDMSYYTPGYFRLFAAIHGNEIWNELAGDAYRILHAAAHPVTGLVPDWQSADGIPGGSDPNSTWTNYYRYDASRVPWRIGLDYLWNGDTLARDWCIKVSDWAAGIGPANLVDGYDLDGGVRGQYHNSTFVGGFMVGTMCNSQGLADAFGSELTGITDNQYFNLSVRCLYLLVATGNFWQPAMEFTEADSVHVFTDDSIDSIAVNAGTLQMRARVFPDTAFSNTVTWSVINGTGEATIDQNGLLMAVTNGTVTVRATADDPGKAYDEMLIRISNQDNTTAGKMNRSFSIYPNPADEMICLGGAAQVVRIRLISVDGRVWVQLVNPGLEKLLIPTGELESGLYWIQIRNRDGSVLMANFIRR